MDINEMTKEELIELIKNSDSIKFDKLGLYWDREREPEEIVEKCREDLPVLYNVSEKDILIENSNLTNLIIEGDNFHVLNVLNYTHEESIDVIYIDPPYNTKNSSFKYNDKFVDPEDGYKHSKWLNFMEKRLILSKNLLSESGVIVISIDDVEVAHLKLLCDKIFGESNCLGLLPTIMNLKGNNDQFGFSGTHEYTLVYAKKKSNVKLGQFDIEEEEIEKNWSKDEYGYFKQGAGLKATGKEDKREDRAQMFFPIFVKKGKVKMITESEFSSLYSNNSFTDENLDRIIKKYEGKGYITIIPKNKTGYGRWRWSYKTFCNKLDEIIVSRNNRTIYKKQRPSLTDLPTKKPKSLLYKPEYSSGNGTTYLEKMFGEKVFDNPKPLELIKDLITISTTKNDAVILDFFAGSGTTGEAVHRLNQKDNGSRTYILCSNNENNICEEITYERIRKTLLGYTNIDGEKIEGTSGNVKYFKTDFVKESSSRDQLFYDLTEKCIPMLCVKENTHKVVKKTEEYIIYSDSMNTKYTCVYFDFYSIKYEEYIREISKIDKQKALYIFSLDDYISREELIDVSNYSIEPIPYKILQQYEKVTRGL